MNSPKVTLLLFVFVALTCLYSISTFIKAKDSGLATPAISSTKEKSIFQIKEDARKNYPTADYNEPLPDELSKSNAMKRKKARYDKAHVVVDNPPPTAGDQVSLLEGSFDFPALPVNQSYLIVRGAVLNASAHLSNDKHNVFSEFDLRVESVLKGASVSEGSVISIEREGGYVKYPNGQKLLYRNAGYGMPKPGVTYVLFLKASDGDFQILTGYELSNGQVFPLDQSGQFEKLSGLSEAEFLTRLSDALSGKVKDVQ